MNRGHLEHWSGGAGLGFVVLFIAGIAVGFTALASAMGTAGGTSVMPESSEQMLAVVQEARIGLGASAYLLSLAAVAFVWFSWGLAVALRGDAERDGGIWILVVAGGVLYAAHLLGWISVLMQGVFLATSNAAAETAVDAMMRGPYDKILWAADWMFPGILFIGATGLSARNGASLPRSLGRMSLALAASLIVLAGLADILLLPIAWLGFPIFLLGWVPWTSVVLLRGPSPRRAARELEPPATRGPA